MVLCDEPGTTLSDQIAGLPDHHLVGGNEYKMQHHPIAITTNQSSNHSQSEQQQSQRAAQNAPPSDANNDAPEQPEVPAGPVCLPAVHTVSGYPYLDEVIRGFGSVAIVVG